MYAQAHTWHTPTHVFTKKCVCESTNIYWYGHVQWYVKLCKYGYTHNQVYEYSLKCHITTNFL